MKSDLVFSRKVCACVRACVRAGQGQRRAYMAADSPTSTYRLAGIVEADDEHVVLGLPQRVLYAAVEQAEHVRARVVVVALAAAAAKQRRSSSRFGRSLLLVRSRSRSRSWPCCLAQLSRGPGSQPTMTNGTLYFGVCVCVCCVCVCMHVRVPAWR